MHTGKKPETQKTFDKPTLLVTRMESSNKRSRNLDGNVPNVNWNSDDDKLNVNWYNVNNRNDNLRSRRSF